MESSDTCSEHEDATEQSPTNLQYLNKDLLGRDIEEQDDNSSTQSIAGCSEVQSVSDDDSCIVLSSDDETDDEKKPTDEQLWKNDHVCSVCKYTFSCVEEAGSKVNPKTRTCLSCRGKMSFEGQVDYRSTEVAPLEFPNCQQRSEIIETLQAAPKLTNKDIIDSEEVGPSSQSDNSIQSDEEQVAGQSAVMHDLAQKTGLMEEVEKISFEEGRKESSKDVDPIENPEDSEESEEIDFEENIMSREKEIAMKKLIKRSLKPKMTNWLLYRQEQKKRAARLLRAQTARDKVDILMRPFRKAQNMRNGWSIWDILPFPNSMQLYLIRKHTGLRMKELKKWFDGERRRLRSVGCKKKAM